MCSMPPARNFIVEFKEGYRRRYENERYMWHALATTFMYIFIIYLYFPACGLAVYLHLAVSVYFICDLCVGIAKISLYSFLIYSPK